MNLIFNHFNFFITHTHTQNNPLLIAFNRMNPWTFPASLSKREGKWIDKTVNTTSQDN